MGFHNAQAVEVIAAEKGIGHAATRLAFHIALNTLDHDSEEDGHPRCLYYKGRDAMAHGLGILVAQYDDGAEGSRARAAAYAAVKRAVRELTNAGMLELVETGSGHLRSRYRLLVPEVAKRVYRSRDPVEKFAGAQF